MRSGKNLAVILALAAMALATFTARRSDPAAEATRQLFDKARIAKSTLPYEKDGAGLPELEAYIQRLRSIDPARAPVDVQGAFRRYIEAAASDAEVRRNRGDTNAADAGWSQAEQAFGVAVNSHTTTPF